MKEEWNIADEKLQIENAGVGKTTAEYFLGAGNGMGSVLSEGGEEKCMVVSLDDYIDKKVDFIAADVESFEFDMLSEQNRL